jgi:uncharacterized protein YprB with RNaseH-like and TPR domain
VPGIGLKTERKLWERGVLSWYDLMRDASKDSRVNYYLEESIKRLEEHDPAYFAGALPAGEAWRLFPEFRDYAAYLDIETTGTVGASDYITTIAMYDGEMISHYIHGYNLDDFRRDVQRYKVIVTYNGKSFDIPFINRFFDINVRAAQIDLRYVLHSLGYRGGLKGCEKQLGVERDGLDGVDGYFAVLLWDEYRCSGNTRALETLLAYNVLDAVNLETLMVMAYNEKLMDTPFADTLPLPLPEVPRNPFEPHEGTIKRIMNRFIKT